MPTASLSARTAAVRQFNRFYTRQIGVLNEKLLRSDFSLTEVRVLYELAHGSATTASGLVTGLALDPGYVSRIVHRLERAGLLRRTVSREDARQSRLALTARGRRTIARLEETSNLQVQQLLARLSEEKQAALVEAMRNIETILGRDENRRSEVTLRTYRPGDIGWIVSRHGALYAQEYGWNEEFEGLVARICADFLAHYDPARERCWIAERDGERVGCVFLVRESAKTARLRMLLVEPSARGLGIGSRLVNECIEFARAAGYTKIVLWTENVLTSARAIYKAAGFKLTKAKKHRAFGHDLVSEDWMLELTPAKPR